MSAALTRSKKLEHGTNELTQPAERSIPGQLEAQPVTEVAKFTGVDCGAISDHGMTPLMRAACDGLAGTVQALLDRGAEVNAKRADGFNALSLAAFFGQSQVVWLLLENDADLDPTGRTETSPERWANVRGFVDIGEILKEAGAVRQVEASSPRTAVIDEPARFPRPAEKETLQRSGDPVPSVKDSVSDEATDSEITLPMSPAPVVKESAERKSESTADTVDILPNDKPEQPQRQPVIKQSLRASKNLPEIKDPPPLAVPEFHPGSVFVARITSSRKTLVALLLAVLLVCGGIAAFLIPQIRESLASARTEAVTRTSNAPTEPSNPVAGSGASVSGTLESPSAAPTESTTSPVAKGVEEITPDSTRVESTLPIEAAEVSEKGSAGIATASGSESRAHTWSGNRVPEAFENKREFSIATSMSRPVARARKHRAVSRALKLKPQTVAEELPKPAPLSVEVTRGRSVLSAPARSADEVIGSQPPPLSIISDKPKSKVIQWP